MLSNTNIDFIVFMTDRWLLFDIFIIVIRVKKKIDPFSEKFLRRMQSLSNRSACKDASKVLKNIETKGWRFKYPMESEYCILTIYVNL